MPKKNAKDIVTIIFDELNDKSTKTANEIAMRCKSNPETIRFYAELIHFIQSKEKMNIKEIRSGSRTVTFISIGEIITDVS